MLWKKRKGKGVPLPVEQGKGAPIRLTKPALKRRLNFRTAACLGKEGERGAQLHRIDAAEHVPGIRMRHLIEGVHAFAEALPENGMGKEGACFVDATDAEVPGSRTLAKPRQLRKDEPHPVAPLIPGTDLCKRLRISVILCVQEALQIMRIIHSFCMAARSAAIPSFISGHSHSVLARRVFLELAALCRTWRSGIGGFAAAHAVVVAMLLVALAATA